MTASAANAVQGLTKSSGTIFHLFPHFSWTQMISKIKGMEFLGEISKIGWEFGNEC